MAHQCLECGEVYEEGSPELLKGCAECGGTRFFFTQKPLDEEERDELQEQANEDLKAIVQDLLEGGEKPDYDDDIWSTDTRREWLALDPEDAGKTVKEYVEEMTDESGSKADPEVVEELEDLVESGDAKVMDSLDIDVVEDEEPGGSERVAEVEVDPFIDPEPKAAEQEPDPDVAPPPPEDAPSAPDDAPAEAPVEADAPAAPDEPPAPPVQTSLEDAPEPEAEPPSPPAPAPVPEEMWVPDEEADEDAEGRPEVVTVAEEGSYEIDVEGLMGDSPIIVQNDGKYLVHLPSLFQSKKVKKGSS